MKIAYLFTEIPGIAGTFPNAELDGMRSRDLKIELFVLRASVDTNAEIRRIQSLFPVHRSPYLLSVRLWLDCIAVGVRHPILLAKTVLQVVRDAAGSPPVLLKSLAILPKAIHFSAVARRREVTLMHAYWASLPALAASVMSRFSGIPFTMWAHASADIYVRRLQTPRALRSRLLETTRVFTCHEANLQTFSELVGPETMVKVVHITHGVDIERFHPCTQESSLGSTPVILTVGRLSPAKGIDILIDACRVLADQGRRFECRIAGDGKLATHLRQRAAASRLGESIRFLGHVDHEDLPRQYEAATLFVIPSVPMAGGAREGLPNSLLEAMACGVASIGTSIGSIVQVIEHEQTGLLVPPGNPGELAKAIGRLLDDPELRIRIARESVVRMRSGYSQSISHERVYREFVQIHGG